MSARKTEHHGSPTVLRARDSRTDGPHWQQLQQLMHDALESLREGVIIMSSDGTVITANPAARSILGSSLELKDLPYLHHSLFLADGRTPYPAEDLPLHRALRGETCTDEIIAINHEEEGVRYIQISARSIPARGKQLGGAVATFRDVTTERRLVQEIERIALSDQLTGVPNRRGCDLALSREIERARRHSRTLSVGLVDIDFFKRINDAHGHAMGDRVLKVVAERILESLRPEDFAGRWGGEEFIVLLPEASLQGAYRAAERIRTSVATSGAPVPVTCSIGVASLNPLYDVNALIKAADGALYSAKKSGRNCVCIPT